MGDAAGPAYTPTNTATAFWASVYRVANGLNFVYTGLVIRELTIRGREGELIECTVDCIGKTESTNTTLVTGTYGITPEYQPFHFADISTFTIGGAAMSARSFELKITNTLEPKYYNSLTATDICVANRVITFSTELSFSDEFALYPQSGATALPVALTLTGTGVSVAITMALVRPSNESPTISGRTDIPLIWKGEAGGSATGNDEISVTVDAAP